MDPAGWASVDDVLHHLRLGRDALEEIVATNTKRRLEIDGDRIRACQGHSDGVPVTLEALEDSWRLFAGDASIWHGTSVRAARAIAIDGIEPRGRTHVHMTSALHSVVGKRAGVALMLEVSPAALRAAGREVFVSPNGVVLVRDVPPTCIVGWMPISDNARRADLKFGPA